MQSLGLCGYSSVNTTTENHR